MWCWKTIFSIASAQPVCERMSSVIFSVSSLSENLDDFKKFWKVLSASVTLSFLCCESSTRADVCVLSVVQNVICVHFSNYFDVVIRWSRRVVKHPYGKLSTETGRNWSDLIVPCIQFLELCEILQQIFWQCSYFVLRISSSSMRKFSLIDWNSILIQSNFFRCFRLLSISITELVSLNLKKLSFVCLRTESMNDVSNSSKSHQFIIDGKVRSNRISETESRSPFFSCGIGDIE